MSADQEIFDITDGRHRYAPCPRCGAKLGMGLCNRPGGVAVECAQCDFRGPEFRGVSWHEDDRRAFEGWNAIPRTESASVKTTEG